MRATAFSGRPGSGLAHRFQLTGTLWCEGFASSPERCGRRWYSAHPPRVLEAKDRKTLRASPAYESYITIEGERHHELEVKSSKFRTTAWPVTTSEQAFECIRIARNSAASHNCFAYRVGPDFRSSDDGEPTGTAGKPILSVIEREGLDRVCVLVTRYFGGTKLGAGGLYRAYAAAAQSCLQGAPRCSAKTQVTLRVQAKAADMGIAYAVLEQYEANVVSQEFGQDGQLAMTLSLAYDLASDMQSAMANASSGKIQVFQT